MRIGSISTGAVLGALIVAVCGAGVATAATGNSLLLGHQNKASGTTTLKASSGAALSLQVGPGRPPLTVNSGTQVPNLNASELDGLTAKQLMAGAGSASPGLNVTQVVAQMSASTGIALCPPGTVPLGGGVLPDVTGAEGIPFVVASFPHLSAASVPDGWEGIAADLQPGYDGEGYVFVSCVAGTLSVSPQAAVAGSDARGAARMARAR